MQGLDLSKLIHICIFLRFFSMVTMLPGTNPLFLGSYDRDPWSEQRCAHRRSDTIFSGGGTNDKDG